MVDGANFRGTLVLIAYKISVEYIEFESWILNMKGVSKKMEIYEQPFEFELGSKNIWNEIELF